MSAKKAKAGFPQAGLCVILAFAALPPIAESAASPTSQKTATFPAGASQIDITPEFPVRMYGYGSRTTESEGVAGKLYARALAIGGDSAEGPALLLSVDCGAVPQAIRTEVLRRLRARRKIRPERFVLCNTHTHSAPDLMGMNSLAGGERERLETYGLELTARLVRVCLKALETRRPSTLQWGEGTVRFARNRRVLKDGKWTGFGAVADAPADHTLSVLKVADEDGALVAVLSNYACHATTLRGNFKRIHGDCPGYARGFIEKEHPGAVALISIGCGADSDPYPHGTLQRAERHGLELAREVSRVLAGPLKRIRSELTAKSAVLTIPFNPPPPPEEWERRSKHSWSLKEIFERLKKGEKLPPMEYTITTWVFGNDLTMIFLTGEVVVDYTAKIRKAFPGRPLWITAYAHEVPCYLISKRLIGEGGYEVLNSLSSRITFGKPEEFRPPMEERIVDAIRVLLSGKSAVRPAAGKRQNSP